MSAGIWVGIVDLCNYSRGETFSRVNNIESESFFGDARLLYKNLHKSKLCMRVRVLKYIGERLSHI